MKLPILFPIAALGLALSSQAAIRGAIDMNLDASGNLTESASGMKLKVNSQRTPLNLPGAAGQALLLDGYSSFVNSPIPEMASGEDSYTISLWVAPETYPMMRLDEQTADQALVVGTYDASAKAGFGFFLGREGDFSYKYFSSGWPGAVNASRRLPLAQWTLVTVTVDSQARKVHLYFNGEEVGSANCMASTPIPAANLMIGHDATPGQNAMGFRLDTFNGMIDDLTISEGVNVPSAADCVAQNDALFAIPSEWWADEPLRPLFHAMPARSWMNECHGLTYSDGRWHLFFQKNGNGPYMSRLHWGHVSSADLCTWREEPIAIAPGESYDIKGCWSGCLFSDPVLTAGQPRAFYTGVDYGRARIIEAIPTDASLSNWRKKGIVVDGAPGGLSDDMRDCYIFRNGDDYFMIVGTSKDNKGACTLHKLDRTTGVWSNDGKIFWQASNASLLGRFWEMPSLTKIGDHWLFCVTPLDMSGGVRAIYWIGDLNSDGTFSPITPANQPGTIELAGTSRDGFGLLSPSVYNTTDGRTLAMGIVPDKLGGPDNALLGWAHNISLPREWSLSADNKLLQKPARELAAMRSSRINYSDNSFSLTGSRELGDVPGHRCEVRLVMTKGTAKSGIRLMEENGRGVKVEYDPNMNTVTVDMRELDRKNNDGSSFAGLYSGSIPENVPVGGDIILDVFADGSILDIFINDRYAFSTRVFPNGIVSPKASIYSEGNTDIKSVDAWMLEAGEGSGVGELTGSLNEQGITGRRSSGEILISGLSHGEPVAVFSIDGKHLLSTYASGSELRLSAEDFPGFIVVRSTKGSCKI